MKLFEYNNNDIKDNKQYKLKSLKSLLFMVR